MYVHGYGSKSGVKFVMWGLGEVGNWGIKQTFVFSFFLLLFLVFQEEAKEAFQMFTFE